MAIEPTRLRFTVAEYEALGHLEEFAHDRRLELIDGEIVEMAPIGIGHGGCVMRLNSLFTAGLGPRAVVNVQNPVVLGDWSEPQPDMTVLVAPLDRYLYRHPRADDIQLLIEVSDSTLRFDRTVKAPLYARQGVPEVWIVDLRKKVVELHRQLVVDAYGLVERRGRRETVSPAAFPDLVIAVDAILG